MVMRQAINQHVVFYVKNDEIHDEIYPPVFRPIIRKSHFLTILKQFVNINSFSL
jgi:hypothetical protein